MKNLLNIKTLGYGILIAAAVTLTISQSACKKKVDPEPKKEEDKKVLDPGDTAAKVDYILFDGYRVNMKNPAKGTLKAGQFDTTYEWRGNEPTGIDGDTVLVIFHSSFTRTAKNYSPSMIPSDANKVKISLGWGSSAGKPDVSIIGGTYKLERLNGFWVSTLTNGTGEWDKGGGDIETFKDIEFRATWPD